MVAVEEGHLGGGFEPDLVAGVGGEEVEGVDGEVELAAVGELADGGAEGEEAVAGDVGGAADEGVADVEDAVLVEAEAVAAGGGVGALVGGAIHQVFEVVSDEFEELLEDGRRLRLV